MTCQVSSPPLPFSPSPTLPLSLSFISNVSAEELTIIVSPEAAGQRLDAFLAAQLTGTSRAQIQRAIAGGGVVVNERTVKPSYRVRAGEEIQVELPEAAPLAAAPEPIPLEIVYEDDELIVINKPAGMVVH